MDRPISLKPIVKEMINKIKDEAKILALITLKTSQILVYRQNPL